MLLAAVYGPADYFVLALAILFSALLVYSVLKGWTSGAIESFFWILLTVVIMAGGIWLFIDGGRTGQADANAKRDLTDQDLVVYKVSTEHSTATVGTPQCKYDLTLYKENGQYKVGAVGELTNSSNKIFVNIKDLGLLNKAGC